MAGREFAGVEAGDHCLSDERHFFGVRVPFVEGARVDPADEFEVDVRWKRVRKGKGLKKREIMIFDQKTGQKSLFS